MRKPYTFALLHATKGDYNHALGIRDKWLESSRSPDLIQHVFGFSDDDKSSVKLKQHCETSNCEYVCIPNANKLGGTAVDNWNATLEKANAYFYFIIADDLIPPKHWDKDIWNSIGFAYNSLAVISVDDASDIRYEMDRIGMRDEKKLRDYSILPRHPIVSWKWVEKYGRVFHSSYSGIFCDNDIHAEAVFQQSFLFLPNIKLVHKDISLEKTRQPHTNGEVLYSKENRKTSELNFIKRYGDMEKEYKITPTGYEN